MNISLGDFSCQSEDLVCELGNLDLILGIDWLKTLGEVIHDWKDQSMPFKQGDRWVELKASPSPMGSPTSLKAWLAKNSNNCWGQLAAVKEWDATATQN